MICPKCNSKYEGEYKFCLSCGTPLVDEASVASAQPSVATDDTTLAADGTTLAADGTSAPEGAAPAAAPSAQNLWGIPAKTTAVLEKKNIPVKKAIIGITTAVVLLLAAIIGLSVFFSMRTPAYVVYESDGDLFFSGGKKPVEIESTDKLGYSMFMSNDAKKMFYIKEGDLYIKNVTKANADAEKIASNVYGFAPSENGKRVIYAKSSGLYISDLKNEDKITGDNCKSMIPSKDLSKIAYIDDEGDLYIYKSKKEQKITSDVSSIEYADIDLNNIIFSKNDKLYKVKGTSFEKILSDYSRIIAIMSEKAIYYIETNDDGDNVLYFFDGNTSHKLDSDYGSSDVRVKEANILIYHTYDEDYNPTYKIAKGKTVSKISGIDNVEEFYRGDNEKSIYALAVNEDSDDTQYDLYSISSNGSCVRIQEDVSDRGIKVLPSGKILYYADVSDGLGDLYCSGKKLDGDVIVGSAKATDLSNKILYYTDGETLKVASENGGTGKKIADDVEEFTFAENGDILYIADGDLFRSTGGKGTRVATDVSEIVDVPTVKRFWKLYGNDFI